MKPARPSFVDHLFRWQPHARRDICGRGDRPMAFMPENRFGAGAKRVFCWSQSQAGLAIQPLFGLGFRLRWSGLAVEGLSVFGYGLAARVRVLSVCVRICVLFVRFFVRLSMNLGESARISRFGKRHHRVFRHSPASNLRRIWIIGHKTNAKDVLYSSGKQDKRRTGQWMSCRRFCVLCQY